MSNPSQTGALAPGGSVTLSQVTLARPIADRHAVLVHANGALAAIFVRLDHDAHEEIQGRWVLEVGFGPYDVTPPPVFATLGAAAAWVEQVAEAAVARLVRLAIGEAAG